MLGNRIQAAFAGALVLLLALGGCAKSPPSRFFTLTPLPEVAARSGVIDGGGIALGIGPVVFPQFLDRPQIVVRDGTNQLQLDEFERWGGTVQDDFLRVWAENLAHLLGTSRILVFPSESRMPIDFRITAEVVTFEAQPDGQAVLKVRWTVMDSYLEQTLAAREDVYRSPIVYPTSPVATPGRARPGGPLAALTATGGWGGESTRDSEAVVAAMSRALGDFSRDVAAVLRTLPPPLALPAPLPAPPPPSSPTVQPM